jgi:hypothetical protein
MTKTWLTDNNGNRCSVEHFGSREAAQEALDSLIDCSDCSDCSRCSDCSDKKDEEDEEDEVKPPPVPIIPDIHKVIYAAASDPGALAMEDVHTCDNTHCRGGWVIAKAGEAGSKLEDFYGWNLAAMMIYDASAPGYKINPCRFYDSNAEALEDMRKLAEGE